MNEREQLEQEIRNLQCELTASDYKIIKCYECELIGGPVPYDVAAIHAERQAMRDEINRIQQVLDNG